MRRFIIGMIVLICIGSVGAGAATFYVAEDGSDSNTGTNGWDDALLTIGSAVSKAANADTILVSNGTYFVTANINVTKALDIRGFSGKPQDTIVNGNFPATTNRCFFINHTGAVVSAFTITNGCAYAGGGGGVRMQGGVVSNCIISGNRAFATNTLGIHGGGGVALEVTVYGALVDSVIKGNVTSNGGGGICSYNPLGYLLISNCQVVGNASITNVYVTQSGTGGGIQFAPASSGYGLLTHCLIASNTSSRSAGGISFSPTYILNFARILALK